MVFEGEADRHVSARLSQARPKAEVAVAIFGTHATLRLGRASSFIRVRWGSFTGN